MPSFTGRPTSAEPRAPSPYDHVPAQMRIKLERISLGLLSAIVSWLKSSAVHHFWLLIIIIVSKIETPLCRAYVGHVISPELRSCRDFSKATQATDGRFPACGEAMGLEGLISDDMYFVPVPRQISEAMMRIASCNRQSLESQCSSPRSQHVRCLSRGAAGRRQLQTRYNAHLPEFESEKLTSIQYG